MSSARSPSPPSLLSDEDDRPSASAVKTATTSLSSQEHRHDPTTLDAAIASTTDVLSQQEASLKSPLILPWWRAWILQKLDALRGKILQDQPVFAEDWQHSIIIPIAIGVLSILLFLGPRTIVSLLLQSSLNMIGVMLGIGLGLGLATHVSDLLSMAYIRNGSSTTTSGSTTTTTTATTNLQSQFLLQQQASSSLLMMRQKSISTAALGLEEPDGYASLMQSAGYITTTVVTGTTTIPEGTTASTGATGTTPSSSSKSTILRGQVLRSDDAYFQAYYRFCDNKALGLFHEIFPVIPESIRTVLSQLVEYIMRDFVACWYCKIDTGCIYPSQLDNNNNSSSRHPFPRRMVYEVGTHRKLPCLEKIYESTVIFAGGLTTRIEHVNVFALVLLHWTRIFAHTFKVYRALRKSVVHKLSSHNQQNHPNQTNRPSGSPKQSNLSSSSTTTQQHPSHATSASNVKVSEVSMTKEFLLAGKLHRAITFGMDVPSVLFADAHGKETGRPSEDVQVGARVVQQQQTATSSSSESGGASSQTLDDMILQQRLDVLIAECELDYHRVLSHRMMRALLPRNDFQCHILSSLMIEILAGCVLTPLLQTVSSPEYINSWIIMGLSSQNTDSTAIDHNNANHHEGDETSTATATTRGDSHRTVTEATAERGIEVASVSHDEGGALTVNVQVAEETEDKGTDGTSNSNKDELASRPDWNSGGTTPSSPTSGMRTPTSSRSVAVVHDVTSTADSILTLLGLALIELQQHVDLDEPGRMQSIDWDNAACRAAVLKLVLVIEAAMMDGRCTYNKPDATDDDDGRLDEDNGERSEDDNEIDDDDAGGADKGSEHPVEVTLPEFESATLSQLLMEMTSDLEAFEERVATENVMTGTGKCSRFNDVYAQDYTPTSTEQSTLRTLIAAWLHTGQIYRTITVLVQAHTTVLAPYYRPQAFLRIASNANGFVRKLKALDGIEILVDTMAVLAAPRLLEASGDELAALVHKSTMPSIQSTSTPAQTPREDPTASLSLAAFGLSSSVSTPRFLDFNRNEAFATSLRSERERRMQSWESITRESDGDGAPLPIVCRSRGVTQTDIAIHKELHHLARIFYGNTNIVTIRDAARRRSSDGGAGASISEASDLTDAVPVCLLTVESASQRRRIEIPDDDSSFLLRAQPRPLNAVGVHRDQRNHDQSFKCFAATYEEPTGRSNSEQGSGGRFIRRCLVRYYPIDRTASVALQSGDGRKLDQRRNRAPVPVTITVGQSSRAAPFLSSEFLRERHLCQRWIPKGTTRTQSILASSVMEPTDFNSMPRSGRAIDFVYRLSFFERPMIDLGGKHFTVHDSSSLGTHRADASSLELSDATLSAALLMLGESEPDKADDHPEGRNAIEMGRDGYPVIWMKFTRKEEDAPVEVKPYRLSFVRAALLLTAARHEAQLQNLSNCVRTGSAKKATKALTENLLRPTLRLLEYSGSRSREKQSVLLRDLKLGVNHIDREQLRRNGLLSPRYPTIIRELTATVEDGFMAHEIQGVDLYGATGTVFKIRCVATIEIDIDDSDMESYPGYMSDGGTMCKSANEEWVVYRTLKDFTAFHKHVKLQVSVTESSGTAGSRLVGAATAAFATANGLPGRVKQRELLIPSLAQASKTGALGVTKKSTQKRKEALDTYLKHFLSPCHLLSRSSELLLFLGASFPLSPDLRPGCVLAGIGDPLGRTEMKRTVLLTRSEQSPRNPDEDAANPPEMPPPTNRASRTVSSASILSSGSHDEELIDDSDVRESTRKSRKLVMIPSIGAKIEKIPLAQFRHRIFELVRYLFGFENASFVRNRMLAALKTVSFAVTSNAEFQKMLYNAHTEQLSADALSSWINFAIDLIWPNGEFFTSSPPTPVDQLEEQARTARKVLHESFPEQIRAILGQELTKDGLDILYEMLQNRVVMKSVAYMLFDLLWLEVFPEIGDVLECGSVLDILD